MPGHVQGHGPGDREGKAGPSQDTIDVTGTNRVPALVQRLDLLGARGSAATITPDTSISERNRSITSSISGKLSRISWDREPGRIATRCSVSGRPGVGAASMVRLKLGCPTKVAGRPRRKPISLKGNRQANASVWRRSLANRPSQRRAQILGAPSGRFWPPRAESRGDSELSRRRIDGDMHHWSLIRPMLLELLNQSGQFTHPSCSFKPHNSSRCGLGHQLGPASCVNGPAAARRRHSGWRRRNSATTGRMAVTRRLKCGEEDRCHASKVSGE